MPVTLLFEIVSVSLELPNGLKTLHLCNQSSVEADDRRLPKQSEVSYLTPTKATEVVAAMTFESLTNCWTVFDSSNGSKDMELEWYTKTKLKLNLFCYAPPIDDGNKVHV